MWKVEEEYTVKLGGNTYINVPKLIVFKGESLFKIERAESTGLLGISFDIYDPNGTKIASVKQGRIYSGPVTRFDIQQNVDQYTMTDRVTKKVLCDIRKRDMAQGAELDVSVTLYTKTGYLIDLTPTTTNIPGASIGGNIMKGGQIGINIS